MPPEVLTSDAVHSLVKDCLFAPGEATDSAVIGEGVMARMGFHPDRLAVNKPRIMALLMELPEEFRASGAGGWSFLNACNDRHGRQWTGLHSVMDALLTLGIASGQARVLLPREMWSVLPGGVPYFAVLDATPAAEAA